MERPDARYVFEQNFYDGRRLYRLVHHLKFTFHEDGWWGARLACNAQVVGGGVTNDTKWDEQPFLLDEVVTCLTCLVRSSS